MATDGPAKIDTTAPTTRSRGIYTGQAIHDGVATSSFFTSREVQFGEV
jgi:hypothetical protein